MIPTQTSNKQNDLDFKNESRVATKLLDAHNQENGIISLVLVCS